MGIGCIFVFLVVGCTITKFLLRLGIPKFKPWSINNQYYPDNKKLYVQPRKDLMMGNQDYDTYRDMFKSTSYQADHNFTTTNRMMGNHNSQTIANTINMPHVYRYET